MISFASSIIKRVSELKRHSLKNSRIYPAVFALSRSMVPGVGLEVELVIRSPGVAKARRGCFQPQLVFGFDSEFQLRPLLCYEDSTTPKKAPCRQTARGRAAGSR